MGRGIYQVDKRGDHLSMQRNGGGKVRAHIHMGLQTAVFLYCDSLGKAVVWAIGQQV